MKKLVYIVLFFSVFLVKTKVLADTPVLDGNNFYTKGCSITIEDRSDNLSGATINWNGGTINVNEDVSIFGGGDVGSAYNESHIVMTGGKVKTIYGGGNGNTTTTSDVTTSNIKIDGGTVTNAIYGGGRLSAIVTTANIHMTDGIVSNIVGGGGASSGNLSVGTYQTMNASPNHTINANITVSGGVIGSAVFGGGQGYSHVSKSSIMINGDAKIAYLVGSGSNGRTDEIFMNIIEGEIEIVQGVNRGTIGNLAITVNGADIDKLYLLGDSDDSSVNGKIDDDATVNLNVISGLINNVYPGTNDGIELVDTSNIKIAYIERTIGNIDNLNTIFTNLENIIPVITPPILDDLPQTGVNEKNLNFMFLIPLVIGIIIKIKLSNI